MAEMGYLCKFLPRADAAIDRGEVCLLQQTYHLEISDRPRHCIRQLPDPWLRRRHSGGALAAARADDGNKRMLLFGWSTAVIFEVLQRTLRRR
jgi:hypothetical protein